MDTNPVLEVAQSPEARLEALFSGEAAKPEQETPEVEAEDTDEPEADETEAVEEDQAEEPDAPVLEDAELEGETYKLPPKVAEVVKKAESLQKDYTQKTQALADEKRVYEDKRQFVEAREYLLSQSFAEAAELQATQAELAKYEGIDWNTLMAENPQQAWALSNSKNLLTAKLAEKQQALQKTADQMKVAREKHEAQQMALGKQELERRIGPVKEADRERLMATAQELKYTEAEMKSPAALHALHLASKWLALQKSRPELSKKVAQAKPMSAPSARSASTSIEQAKRDELKTRVVKTGRSDDAEAYLTRLFESKRKR
jgi:fructose-specific component phosphotransferase system IIB-like protein